MKNQEGHWGVLLMSLGRESGLMWRQQQQYLFSVFLGGFRHNDQTFWNVLIWYVRFKPSEHENHVYVGYTCALSPQQKDFARDDAPLGDDEEAVPAAGIPFSWARSTHVTFSSAIYMAVWTRNKTHKNAASCGRDTKYQITCSTVRAPQPAGLTAIDNVSCRFNNIIRVNMLIW